MARYLAGRGITIDPPASLRWAPSCGACWINYGPAMVAPIDNTDGELIGVHRTCLDRRPGWQNGSAATGRCSAAQPVVPSGSPRRPKR